MMLLALALLTTAAHVFAAPVTTHFSQENAVYTAHYDPIIEYRVNYEQQQQLFKEEWEKMWNMLLNQYGLQGAWNMVTSGQIPGFNGSWTWVQANGAPIFSSGTISQLNSNAFAGSNSQLGTNSNAGANSNSGSNSASGVNTNSGAALVNTNYNTQSSLSTSGSNSNSGTNTHQGTNNHQGTNTGPTNYNGPISGSSSIVNTEHKKPIFIQGAVSNVGNAGSIYVP